MSLIESVFELDNNVSFNNNRKKQDILKVSPVSGTVWGSSGVKVLKLIINNIIFYSLNHIYMEKQN